MRALNISEFRAKCLSLVEDLPAEGIVITKRGKPIATLAPIRKRGRSLIGSMAGAFEIRGDILSTGRRWDAES